MQTAGLCAPPPRRFQAVAVGALVYIHSHRSLCDIHVLDTGMEPPVLHKLAVTGDGAASPGPPSRGLHSVVAMGGRLLLFGGAPKEGPMVRYRCATTATHHRDSFTLGGVRVGSGADTHGASST